MKRVLFMVMCITLLVSTLLFAQELEETKGSVVGKEMKGSMMGEHGMMMGKKKMMGKRHMQGMMMKMMMHKEIIATKDGGIIVMTGNKLLKYDKDLKLKKEVEIKMDMEGMQKMMKEIKEKCSMYKEMMEEGGMMESEEPCTSESTSGHESHH